MAQYSQRSQPMHRHSKWLSKAMGSLGDIPAKIQTVCEEHVDPMFIRVLHLQRNLFTGNCNIGDANTKPSSSDIEEASTSGVTKPGTSGVTKPGTTGVTKPGTSGTIPSTSRAKPSISEAIPGPSGSKPRRSPRVQLGSKPSQPKAGPSKAKPPGPSSAKPGSKNASDTKATPKTPDAPLQFETEFVALNDLPSENDELDMEVPEHYKIEIIEDEEELLSTNEATITPNVATLTLNLATPNDPSPRPNVVDLNVANYAPLNFANIAIRQPSVVEKATETLYVMPVPAKRARLDLEQMAGIDTSNTTGISSGLIKEEPCSFETIILPSTIYLADADKPLTQDEPSTSQSVSVVEIKSEEEEDDFDMENEIDSIKFQEESEEPATEPERKDFKTIEEILDDLVQKKLISRVRRRELLECGLLPEQLRLDLAVKNKAPAAKLKNFAITLYLISHKAYKHVIAHYKTVLPTHPTIREWLIQKGGCGFTREALEAIYAKLSKQFTPKVFVCLVVKDVPMTARTSKTEGPRQNRLHFNSALVMVAVAINATWKVPIGYFSTDEVDGSSRGNLVRDAIALLEATGAQPVALSFELTPANREMLSELGCTIGMNMKTSFLSENGKSIFIFPEPYGVLKIISIYNYHESYEDGFGDLVSLSKHASLVLKHLRHMKFLKETTPLTMLVKILDCWENLEKFQEATGTACFLQHIHEVLAVLSSRQGGLGLKKPIPIGKRDPIDNPAIVVLREAGLYFQGIRMKQKGELGQTLCSNAEGAGLLALCGLIDSAIMLMMTYSTEVSIEFGKFSSNPAYFIANLLPHGLDRQTKSASAFIRDYKRMLRHAIGAGVSLPREGNNLPIENIALLTCKPAIERINLSTCLPNGATKWNVEDDLLKVLDFDHSEYEDTIVWHIARFVAFSLASRLKCDTCISAVLSGSEVRGNFPYDHDLFTNTLVNKTFPRKLSDPSSDTIKICKLAEAIFLRAVNVSGDRALSTKFRVFSLVIKVMEEFVGRPLFEGLKQHQFDTDRTCNHVVQLGKAVAEVYLETRVERYLKKKEPKTAKKVPKKHPCNVKLN